MGGYKSYISLGSSCQTAYQLKRLGLRRNAGPLDWFMSPSASGVAQLIRNRFEGFMNMNHLHLIGATNDCFIVRDGVYSIDSFHDFPLSPNVSQWQQAYPAFREKTDRRVNRFLRNTIQNKPVLFIRTFTAKEEAQELKKALHTIMHPKFHLLIVNSFSYDTKHVVFDDWGLDGIYSVRVPPGADWRGSDLAWDTILKRQP